MQTLGQVLEELDSVLVELECVWGMVLDVELLFEDYVMALGIYGLEELLLWELV